MRTTIRDRPATLQREYNQGYIFYFPNACVYVYVYMCVHACSNHVRRYGYTIYIYVYSNLCIFYLLTDSTRNLIVPEFTN